MLRRSNVPRSFAFFHSFVVVCIVVIIGSVVYNAVTGNADGSVCLGGYKHIHGGYYAGYRQITNEQGKGIPCE